MRHTKFYRQKFTTGLLEKFIISRPQGTSVRTIEAYHYTLDGFVNYPITANPIKQVSPPKTQERLRLAVSKEQLNVLLSHCHCERDKALISLLWYSGIRILEAVNIKASDFNLEEGTVIVLGKGNRYRKCLAGNGIVREWFSTHDSFEINKGGAQTMLKRLKAESGIPCNAHSFRRGFCIHQVKSGFLPFTYRTQLTSHFTIAWSYQRFIAKASPRYSDSMGCHVTSGRDW